MIYTSGSTAAPKGVRHTHETMLFGLTLGPGDGRTLVTFPAGHVAAVIGLLRPLCVGGLTVVLDRWSARAAVEAIETHRITASSGTPFFLATLLDEAERTGRDIDSLERFLCGAATVPPALLDRAADRGSSRGARTARPSTPRCARATPTPLPTSGTTPTGIRSP